MLRHRTVRLCQCPSATTAPPGPGTRSAGATHPRGARPTPAHRPAARPRCCRRCRQPRAATARPSPFVQARPH
eukprot:scaffold42075_cov376-Isochrysis_galbana.AAC.1